jgi:hypothetical protein
VYVFIGHRRGGVVARDAGLGPPEQRQNLACIPMASCTLFNSSCVLFLQLLSWGGADVPALLAEVTEAQEAVTAVEATHVMAMPTVETCAREATAARDSAALRVTDAKDQAALAERETLERVSRAKAEYAMALSSTREDAKGFPRKIILLEDKLAAELQAQEVSERERREQFEELTVLQTWGSKLCHAIIGAPQARHHLSEGMRLAALHHTEMAEKPIVLRVAVSSITELMLERSPSDTFRVEVVGELAT